MKIYLKDIKSDGLDADYSMGADEVGLSDKDYLYLIRPLQIQAHFDRVEKTVLCKAKVKTRYKSFCSRTLVNVERDWQDDLILDFPLEKNTKFIDPNEDIRQEVILGLPVKVLCDEELAKDAQAPKESRHDPFDDERKTYQPFADLELKQE